MAQTSGSPYPAVPPICLPSTVPVPLSLCPRLESFIEYGPDKGRPWLCREQASGGTGDLVLAGRV